ncbi:MAG TPA: serine/threonine-protein kinase [Byssovorax sp.]
MRTDEIHPGDIIAGKYRVRAILGRSHGLLVEAFHTEFDQRVVIKLLLAGAGEAREIERFRREARTLAKLESEHVARIIDVGTEPDGSFYLVRQHLEGQDLARFVRDNGPMPLVDAVLIAMQLAEALAETHSHGIIIRELSPEHVMLTQRAGGSPLAKITDFGTAKLMKDAAAPSAGGELTATAMFGLSPYSSPELVRKAKNVDVRTDVWSLGAVLYEMLAGRAPFHGDPTSLMLAIARDNPQPVTQLRRDMPPEIDEILGWAMAKDVDARFKNVHAFTHALAPFASSEGRVLAERVGQIADEARRRKGSASVPPPAPSFPSQRPGGAPPSQREPITEDSVTSLRSQPPSSARGYGASPSIPPPPAMPSFGRGTERGGSADAGRDPSALTTPPQQRGAIDRKVMFAAIGVAAILLPLTVVLAFARRDRASADAAPPTTVIIQTPPMPAPTPPAPVVTVLAATATPPASATGAAPAPSATASASASAEATAPTAEPSDEPTEKPSSKSARSSPRHAAARPPREHAPPREAPPPKEPPPPKETAGGDGTLLAIAVGGNCAFSVNGASKGTSSSLRVALKPGTYSVTCKPSDGASKSKSVTIKTGETSMAAFKLGS